MGRWFRVHDDLVDDPKVQLLSGDLVKALINLWCLASQNGGVLPPMKDMSFKLRMKPQQVALVITELSDAGLIDQVDDLFVPHNWEKRQYKSDTDATAAERSRRYREKQRDGNASVTRDGDASRHTSESVSVSVSVSESVSKKEKEEKKRDDWPSDYGDVFWAAYPRKTEKLSAMKKLAKIRKSGVVTFADLMDGVRRYAASGTEPQYTKHPTTWLNAGCWCDEIQTGGGRGQRTSNSGTARSDAILAAAAREARKIVGDGDMAGTADATEFPFGSGPDGRTASGYHGAGRTASACDDRREPFGGPIIEGEVVPADEADAGLPRGWRVVG